MTDYKTLLLNLNQNLHILQERAAKYAGNEPLELVNQIADHRQAIALIQQTLAGELTADELEEALKPLLLALRNGQVVNITAETYVAGDLVNNITHIVNQALSAVEEADKARAAAQKRLAEGVRDYALRLQSLAAAEGDTDAGSPYKGLLAYRLSDAELFFGREQASADLLRRLQAGPLTVLHSESGAGKSSLLQAGLSPRLLSAGHLPMYLRPYNVAPGLVIKRAFVPDLAAAPEVAQAPLRDFLRQVTAVLGQQAGLYLLLDQFEEVFTLLNESDRAGFVGDLADCIKDPTLNAHWVLALRSEFFSDLANFRPLIENPFENEYRLNRLSQAEARQVILAPAERQGIGFEPALLETLLAELRDDKGELAPPQIQLVCSALYNLLLDRQRSTPGQAALITQQMYDEEGRAEGILRGYLNQVLRNNLPTKQERDLARRVLVALVSSEQRRLRRSRSDLAAQLAIGLTAAQSLDSLLEQLVKSRLLTVVERDEESDQASYELAHDYLLTEIELSPEERARKAAQEMLAQEVKAYQQFGTLLSEDKYTIIHSQREFLALDAAAQELLDRSQAELEAEARAKEAQRQRELAQARQLSRRARWIMAIGIVAVILAVAAGWLGWQAEVRRGEAEQSQQAANAAAATAEANRVKAEQSEQAANAAAATAEANRLEADRQTALALAQLWQIKGQEQFETEPLLGLRLALEAWPRLSAGETQARAAAEQTIRNLAGEGRLLRLGEGNVSHIYVPDHNPAIFILSRTNGPSELRRTADGQIVQKLSGLVDGVTFSPDPAVTYFVVDYDDDTLELRRTADGQVIAKLSGKINNVTFSSDPAAAYFVVGYPDNTPGELRRTPGELRRTADGQVIAKLSGPLQYLGVLFSSDPAAAYFVVHYDDGIPTELRRTADGQVVPLSGQVNDVTFSPDPAAAYFVVSYDDNTPSELRHTTDGQIVAKLSGKINNVTFSSDPAAASFVVVYNDNTPAELRRTTDGQIVATLSVRVKDFYGITFSPDPAATYFVVKYNSGNIPEEMRRTADGQIVAKLSGPVNWVAFSPDPAAAYFVVAYNDNTPSELRRTTGGEVVQKLSGPVTGMYFSPGPSVAYFVVKYNYNTPAELRRTADGQVVAKLSGPTDWSVAFSPDPATSYFALDYMGNTPTELHRTTDGQVVLSGPVDRVYFSPDPTEVYFVVKYATGEKNELWQASSQPPRRLARWDTALEQHHFDVAHDRLVVQYNNQQAYLLDLAWLRAMGGQADTLPIEELIRLACAGPFANPQVWDAAAEAKLQEYLGGRESQACR